VPQHQRELPETGNHRRRQPHGQEWQRVGARSRAPSDEPDAYQSWDERGSDDEVAEEPSFNPAY
jgi:hypothetical protein